MAAISKHVFLCLCFQLAEKDQQLEEKDAVIDSQRAKLLASNRTVSRQAKENSDMKLAVQMPENAADEEHLELWADESKHTVTPVRRNLRNMKKRHDELKKSGFKPIQHLRKAPNARYLWKGVKGFMSKKGTMHFRPQENKVTGKTLHAYHLADEIDVEGVVIGMGLDKISGDWVKDMINGAGRVDNNGQRRITDYTRQPMDTSA